MFCWSIDNPFSYMKNHVESASLRSFGVVSYAADGMTSDDVVNDAGVATTDDVAHDAGSATTDETTQAVQQLMKCIVYQSVFYLVEFFLLFVFMIIGYI